MWCAEAAKYLEGTYLEEGPEHDGAWLERWVVAESEAQAAIDDWCGEYPQATEPGLPRCLLGAVGSNTTFVVSSSMPVRDLEWYGPATDDPPRVLANRGANGIDGVVSTALGVASCSAGPVVAVVGDLAFLHDVSAWVGALPRDPGLTVVVVDNGGGGIFSFLPQRDSLDRETFEQLFGTPQAPEIAAVARGFGVEVKEVSAVTDLGGAIRDATSSGTTSVLRVVVPGRDANVGHHDALNSLIAGRVTEALAKVE
jgi:2-succinyl-5-enolpyruvyl-6-hydroxy-3-cyclohexene-1-carboxylate synthase